MGRLTPEEATRTARARGTSSTPEGVRLHTGRCPVCCASARLYAGRCPAYHAPGYLRFLLASHHADVPHPFVDLHLWRRSSGRWNAGWVLWGRRWRILGASLAVLVGVKMPHQPECVPWE